MEITRGENTYRKAGTSPYRWAGLLMVNYLSVEDRYGPCITQLVDEVGEVKAEIFWSSRALAAAKITQAENDFRQIGKDKLTAETVVRIMKLYEG